MGPAGSEDGQAVTLTVPTLHRQVRGAPGGGAPPGRRAARGPPYFRTCYVHLRGRVLIVWALMPLPCCEPNGTRRERSPGP
eukprot:scaffold2097_cov403-Prasinococcus_capsulatus_cf.AAC.6